MARRKTPPLISPDGVPEPLRNREAPFWRSPDAVAALANELGLPEPVNGWEDAPPWLAFDHFRTAWTKATGLRDAFDNLDFTRARAAGIDTSGSSRWRLLDLTAGSLGRGKQHG